MSTERAFEIGKQIAEDVTADNPYPVKLKFEKVMQPVVLITKKRYVGMSTEEFGGEAVFDAKGIETVRRDGCPFVSKVMEKFLRVLFESNVDTAIHFLRMKLQDIEKYPFSDFIFAKEFRGGYAENAAVPAKKIADRRMLVSERFQPVHGERVPYVVVEGESPTSTVISCVVEPSEYFANQSMRLNYDYYVLRQLLPALHRVLELVPVRLTYSNHEKQDCYGCRAFGQKPWCVRCRTEPLAVSRAIVESAKDQNLLTILKRGCRECATFRCGLDAFEFQCGNLFCPINDKIAFLQKSKAIEAAMTHGLREGAEEWIEEEPVVLM
ncbi:hypothetical protein L596_024299 [Steinernema carpocapsae]|nr:hypothetical protein L596_024299 [Steinernema carpocapsae]